MEMFHVISLMDEAFRNHKLKYTVNETNEYQDIHVPFGIKNGPSVVVRYISHDRRNDVLVRIMNLVNNAPAEKRPRLLDVCNSLNTKFRFIKFTLDAENNLHIEYDFPTNSGDESIGEMAFEIFIRIMQILNEAYPVIATALYAREEQPAEAGEAAGGDKDILQLLRDSHDEINIKISKTKPEEPEN